MKRAEFIGREADPAKSREHALLMVLAERRLSAGEPSPLGALVEGVLTPPIDRIGALDVDDHLSKAERKNLAAALNTLLASSNFALWRQGGPIDVAEWLTPRAGHTPGVIVSGAHLDEEERCLVLGVLLEEVLAFVRTLPGTASLRALIVFDEIYGFMPPHPANPPTKRPLVTALVSDPQYPPRTGNAAGAAPLGHDLPARPNDSPRDQARTTAGGGRERLGANGGVGRARVAHRAAGAGSSLLRMDCRSPSNPTTHLPIARCHDGHRYCQSPAPRSNGTRVPRDVCEAVNEENSRPSLGC